MFKPRDYCTYVHYRKHADGTIIGAWHCALPSPSPSLARGVVSVLVSSSNAHDIKTARVPVFNTLAVFSSPPHHSPEPRGAASGGAPERQGR